jgi:pyruvate-ferredoxin/flavodoxin oxidoreductase
MTKAFSRGTDGFKSPSPLAEFESLRYTLQIAPEDCTGCTLCVEVCPAKSKSEVKHRAINMQPQPPLQNLKQKLGLFPLDT